MFIDVAGSTERRRFLKQVLALAGVSFAGRYVSGCGAGSHDRVIPGDIVGSGSSIGHMIRDGKAIPAPIE